MTGQLLTRADLATMSAAAIVAARAAGELDHLLAPPEPAGPGPALRRVTQLSRADLGALTPGQISLARREGRLADLLGAEAPLQLAADASAPRLDGPGSPSRRT